MVILPVYHQVIAKPTDTAITDASKKRTRITRNHADIITLTIHYLH